MKDSKEKEHRISNLKDMINNVANNEVNADYEEFEEDMELINYLNEDHVDYEDLEIDDEFIYRPGNEDGTAINLEENNINEDFLIKTPKEEKEGEDSSENEEYVDDFTSEVSEGFDTIVHAKIGRTPILAVVGSFLGLLLIVISAILFSSRSDRVIDSGETNFISVIFLIFGLLLLGYGIYKIFGFKNPLEGMSNSIDSIENNEKPESTVKEEPKEKVIPKSNIPLDKESYKIGEFNIKDLKNKFRKHSTPKKPAPPTQEELDKIPPAREKPDEKKGLTAKEIEEIEYEQAIRENESIDDIFAEVEDFEDIPIISVDGEDKLKK